MGRTEIDGRTSNKYSKITDAVEKMLVAEGRIRSRTFTTGYCTGTSGKRITTT